MTQIMNKADLNLYGEKVPMNDRRVPIEQMCDYLEQSLVKQKDKETVSSR